MKVSLRVVNEFDLSLFRKAISFAPLVELRCSKDLEDYLNLVQLIVPRKYWPLHEELGHDASDGKDVRLIVIMVAAKHTFRCSIPPC